MLNKNFMEILKTIAPGTKLREGLDNILRAGTGALIIIGDSKEIIDIVDGGFFIDKEFEPAYLYELAKMDGAIVISKDFKKILYANTLLIPDSSIPTTETGTRHRSAQRAAKQTGELVICISQRRNIITLYKGDFKYIFRETNRILSRANQALQTLDKYYSILEADMNRLSILEFEDMVRQDDVIMVVQRIEMAMRIVEEIKIFIAELGDEGRLISMQLNEILPNLEKERVLLIEDYVNKEAGLNSIKVIENMSKLTNEELMDSVIICRLLGNFKNVNSLEQKASPRGYRLLGKIPRLPVSVQRNLIKRFLNLQGILNASIEELDDVEGIGETRAKNIKSGLKKVREKLLFDNRYIL